MNTAAAIVTTFLVIWANQSNAAPCENIDPSYRNGGGTKIGPFDYNDVTMQQRQHGSPLLMVETEHFTDKVRTLKGGNTSQTPGGDLSYTLWAFPNHHAALLTLINYTEKFNTDQPPEMATTAECYFKHAIQWRPRDAKTRQIYGIYLYKRQKTAESIDQFLEATKIDPENGNYFYNLGLAYVQAKDFDKALDAAHSAYSLGFKMDGLKNKLLRAGRWKEPAPAHPPAAANDMASPEAGAGPVN